MGTSAFSDILHHLETFLTLCEAFGLRREVKASRFRQYQERIQELSHEIGRIRAGEPEAPIYAKLAAGLPRYLVALVESQEVGGMGPFLRARPPGELALKLKALLSGPEMPSDEDHASNQARNIQFELWLATTLWRAGVSVTLAEPDLQCIIGDVTLLIACKRLLSVRKLNKRINEATEQLQRGLGALPEGASWGVIAISLSRVAPNTDRSETISSREEGLEILASRIRVLVERRAKWHQSPVAQAILFHVASKFTNLTTDRLESGSFVTMYGGGPVAGVLAEKLQGVAV